MPWKRRAFHQSRHRAGAQHRRSARHRPRRVPGFVFEYVEGGAEDERRYAATAQPFERLWFVPQTLIDTSSPPPTLPTLGRPANAPLVIAPTGLNGLLHPDADVTLARAAARLGVPYTLSTVSTTRLEEVAQRAGGGCGCSFRHEGARRGARPDAACNGGRLRGAGVHHRCQRVRQPRMGPARLPPTGAAHAARRLDAARHPRWLARCSCATACRAFAILKPSCPRTSRPWARAPVHPAPLRCHHLLGRHRLDPPALARQAVAEGRARRYENAERTAALGIDGIVVSNHGGRQLDSCIAAIEVLPEIVAAVGTRLTILVDGGFRRGTDVVKALALGAKAVMLGRATLYGLIAGGEAGVERALSVLTSEIDRVLGSSAAIRSRSSPRHSCGACEPRQRPGCRAPSDAQPECAQHRGAQRCGDLSSSSRYCFHNAARYAIRGRGCGR